MATFNELGLSDKTLDAVKRLGYDEPTPIQERAIPLVLEGKDIIAAAKTGTGKTAAFSLPALDTLPHVQRGQGPAMLVVTPTRELAQQIGSVCETIAKASHHRILTVVGGLSYNPQVDALRRGIDVLIATPGRLVDLMQQEAVKLKHVKVLVLDEADRMLDMGFWPDMKKIIAATPKERQTLLFSATIDNSITNTIDGILKDPELIEIAHRGETADTVDQYIIPATQHTKAALLKATLNEKGSSRVIVFARTRSRSDSTTRRLRRAGFKAEAIHSDRSQAQRRRALDNFSRGKVDVLVATDVLARGIDVTEVNYVINYDLPNQPEDYVHRIGRTGRAGETGYAISFVSPEQQAWLKDIEKLIKKKIPEMELANFDLEEAKSQVAQKATDANAKNDKELAEAAAEYHKKEKKKPQNSSTNRNRNSKKAPARNPQKVQQKKNVVKATDKDAPRKPSKKTHSGKKEFRGQVAKSKPKTSKKSNKPDLRPGRAHRAAVAKQRKRPN